MPYDHDHEFDWQRFDPPTTPSPSGIFPLSSAGQALLAKVAPTDGESGLSWLTRLERTIPQIRYGNDVPRDFRESVNKSLGGDLPPLLMELWRYAPGILIGFDQFLFDPGTFIMENRRSAQFVPEIMTEMVFFGGGDGFNGAVRLGSDDLTAHEWNHEEGFTGLTAPSMMHYISERLAWYATTRQPFCYQHGYVSHKHP